MLIRNARGWPRSATDDGELTRVPLTDVRIGAGRITECAPGLRPLAREEEVDADGCALLPGLHDHHVHLRALAAAEDSIAVGPSAVRTPAELAARLREHDAALPGGGWLRCVGYHESAPGPLDRWTLDGMLPGSDRPVRVQHRSGALWIVNSAAVARLGLDDQGLGEAGVERDADGRATGRLWRMDRWLSDRLATRSDGSPADLAAVSARAASLGVTGFTDATPGADAADVAGLAEAVAARTVVQRVLSMARADVTSPAAACGGPRFGLGPVKIILDDDRLPSLDDLARQIRQAHAAGRAVAVHCVTRVQLLLTLAALDSAGRVPGDRIEHCALAPAETVPDLRGLTVVTQPHFVAERAGQYLADVPPVDAADLWRLRSLIDGGVAVAAGSDAPFGGADPWHVMRAATDRPAGLGPGEAVSPAAAMRLFLGEPHAPGRARLVAPGHPADLVLLRCSPAEAARSLASDLVAAVFIEGRPDGR